MPKPLRCDDYTVGWICNNDYELAAAVEMLDEEHLPHIRSPDDNDSNIYSLGSIGGHNVAIAALPAGRIGNSWATLVAVQMRMTFKRIRYALMVGVGSGVPGTADVRLGDVIVSEPAGSYPGVVEYDFGKATSSGFQRCGSLDMPSDAFLSAVAAIQWHKARGRDGLRAEIAKMETIPFIRNRKRAPDVLFDAAYEHRGDPTCANCSAENQVPRSPRRTGEAVKVHYGTIASGNQLIADAVTRDRVADDLEGVLCFDIGSAGLMNYIPSLVIRGVCDYADSHGSKGWDLYAAGTAAAYARLVLLTLARRGAKPEPRRDTVSGMGGASRTRFFDRMFGLRRSPFLISCTKVAACLIIAGFTILQYNLDSIQII